MRLSSGGCFAVLLLAAFSPAWGIETPYGSKTLNPQHVRELQINIQQLAQKVNSAPDPETRGRCQEELCKRLVQAEDYDNALRVASSVHESRGVNPERRAAHHFLIAQIYALKMEASPNTALMAENRTRAVQAAQEVVRQGYPDKWMVSEAAQRLLRDLQDPSHIAKVQSGVEKRQNGGSDPEKLAMARAQSQSIEQAVSGGGRLTRTLSKFTRSRASQAPSPVSSADSSKLVVDVKPASYSLGSSVSPKSAPYLSQPSSKSSEIHFSGGTQVIYSQSQPKSGGYLPRESRKSTALASPIIIDGTSVRSAPVTGQGSQVGGGRLIGGEKLSFPSAPSRR